MNGTLHNRSEMVAFSRLHKAADVNVGPERSTRRYQSTPLKGGRSFNEVDSRDRLYLYTPKSREPILS